METINYSIRVATYPFSCPICGSLVKKGKNYIDLGGAYTCFCVLPRRSLIPTGIRRLITSK